MHFAKMRLFKRKDACIALYRAATVTYVGHLPHLTEACPASVANIKDMLPLDTLTLQNSVLTARDRLDTCATPTVAHTLSGRCVGTPGISWAGWERWSENRERASGAQPSLPAASR